MTKVLLKDTMKNVLDIEAKELMQAKENIDDSFVKAVELIYKCKGKLIVIGVGKSGLVGAKIAATFASTGTSSFFVHPTDAMHGDLGMIGKDDIVLAISYSGQSDELKSILPHIKRLDCLIIGLSGDEKSFLAKKSDVFLDIKISQEACPLNAAPTTSTTLTMAIGDALSIALMKKRNFTQKDFASFHPGGSLGKRLFVKIKDIMQSENLPIINTKTSLQQAIEVMTKRRLGNAFIEDKGKIIGVLSDGDLRRAMMREDFSLKKEALLFANTKPKVIYDCNMLASELLKYIEDNKIQLVGILDKNDKLIGAVHIHMLVEAGIN